MNKRDTILIELQEISKTVANLNCYNVYTVPLGYFDRLPTEILAKVKSEILVIGVKSRLYTTPKGYFNDLAENILSKIKHDEGLSSEIFGELENIAPLLNTIDKKNPYYVPHGYLEDLIIQPQNKETAKIVAFGKWKNWGKYAAAAVFAGVLAIAAVKFIGGNSSKKSFEIELAKSSDEEIRQILDNQLPVIYTSIESVSDEQDGLSIFEGTTEEELQQFLKEQPEMAENPNKDI